MFKSVIETYNGFILFGIISIMVFLIDLYAWQAIKTVSAEWNPRFRNLITYSYWTICIAFIIILVIRPVVQIERVGGAIAGVVNALGFIMLLAQIFIIIPLLIEDIIRFFEWILSLFNDSSSKEVMRGRRKFLSYTGIAIGAIPFSSMTYGIVKGAHNYKLHRVKLKLKDLPKSFEGFTIVQISDIHAGSFWSKSGVERGVKMIMEQNADLVLFTGDLVNNAADEMYSWQNLFANITSSNGVYSVLGNHDYGDYMKWNSDEEKAENLRELKRIQAKMGWKLLNNQSAVIEKNGEKIELLGVENWSAKGNFPKYGKLEETIKNSQNLPCQILLSHDPSHWRAEVLKSSKNIKLTLSGHTHGMQFGIETHGFKWSPIKYMYPEWAGLYQENEQYLYVNRGFGYLGYPGRFGIYPEITLFTLSSDN